MNNTDVIKDKELEELFKRHKPHFADDDAFIAKLTKRLDAVEYIRQQQESAIRQYKMAMLLAFVVGIISGGVSILYMLSVPVEVPLFAVKIESGLWLWLSQNSRIITTTGIAFIMSVGLFNIFINLHDIQNIRPYK